MAIKLAELLKFSKQVEREKEAARAPPPPKAPGQLEFGPLEQAIMVLVIVGMVSDPAATGVPSVISPGLMVTLIMGYIGYKLLERQKKREQEARNRPAPKTEPVQSAREKAREKEKEEKAKGSSTNGVKTKEDVIKDSPQRMAAAATKVDKEVRAPTSKTQYFLTMNGPGKPALVPFPRGFKAADDSPEGTLWWNNVSNLKIEDIMVPSAPPGKSSREERKEKEKEKERKALPPGVLGADEIRARAPMEQEMERYEKVMMIMQCILALLLCFIDQTLGLGLLALFLFFHFRREQAKEALRTRNIAALGPGERNPYEEVGGGMFGNED